MIGGLLFATLMTLRRKQVPARPVTTASESAITDGERAGATEAEGAAAAVAADGRTETPEWQPHAAARVTEDDRVPELTPDDAEPPLARDVPEASWSEPTATALSDAAAFAEPEAADEEPATVLYGRGPATVEEEPSVEEEPTPEEESAVEEEPSVEEEPTPEEESAVEEPVAQGVEEEIAVEESVAVALEERSLAEEPGGQAAEQPAVEEAVPEQPSLEEASAGVAAERDIPEEEPFERAGRWWFKRGHELLVYNEQTGEWVPSPTPLPTADPVPARYGAESTANETIRDIAAAEPAEVEEPQVEEPQVEEPQVEEPQVEEPEVEEPEVVEPTGQRGFWKCPACGAVNGSTASTCRMCFAARPAG